MAIYHFSAKVISRANGSSAVASAAYRSASRLPDERLGRHHDFTSKAGVVHSEVMLPEGAPASLKDRTTLWNAVEAGEKRKDAQLAREVEFAIPREVSEAEGIRLARDFVAETFVAKGMIADLNVHWDKAADGSPKPHAHVMLSMRAVGPEGFGGKVREWNSTELLKGWREAWADHANDRLAALDITARIDHRTLAAQGIELEPQHKIGAAGSRRVDRGEDAERAEDHRRIARANGEAIMARPEIALEALTRQQATFTRQDLAKFVHRHSDGKEQFDRVLSAVRTAPELVMLGKDGKGEERLTSRDMIAVEARLERTGEDLAETRGHGVATEHRQDAIERAKGRGLDLSEEQRDAVRHVTGARDLAAVVGYAGSGKSAMLGVAREAWEAEGYTVRGAALSGIAAENLEGGSGIPSRTLASYEHQWAQGRDRLGANDILVIDEAGMIGTRQMERVLSEVHQAGAKVVMVGDPEQLQAIEAGAAFRALTERHGAAEIGEIRRQREDWQREATRALATGRTGEAIEAYVQHGMVQVAETREQARGALIDHWDAQRRSDPAETRIILTHTNAEVRDLNLAARERLRDAGDLGEEVSVAAERGNREFAAGDRIMFLKNDRDMGVKNGTLGDIEAVSAERMSVRLDDGRQAAFDLKDYAHVDHGYAATIHKSQGVTVDRAHVLATSGMDRHAAYVALSRHRDGVKLHYGRDDFADQNHLVRTLGRERAKDMASDYSMDHAAAARAFADRRELPGRTAPNEPRRADARQRGSERGSSPQGREPRRRGMFDGLKLRAPRPPEPTKAPGRAGERDYVRAVERMARAVHTIGRAKGEGMPVLEHQKIAFEHTRDALDKVRPGSARDLVAAANHDPSLAREAAAGRSGPLMDAMTHEAKVRADPALRAERFVERWQGLRHQRGAAQQAGDYVRVERAGQAMKAMAQGLERDADMASLLGNRRQELGLPISPARNRTIGAELSQVPDVRRDRGLTR